VSASSRDDLVIAFDYYDGEAEGVARYRGECRYFVRIASDENDNYEYASVAVDCELFNEIAAMACATTSPSGVFVYSGVNDGLNQRLDQVVPEFRLSANRMSQRTHGRSYLESVRNQYPPQPV